MPFRSLTDPVDLALAIAAVEAAWARIRSSSYEFLGSEEQERERLKFIVAIWYRSPWMRMISSREPSNALRDSVVAGADTEEPHPQ